MNFRILSRMQVCFIYLFISFNLNGQVDKDSSIYKMDSFLGILTYSMIDNN